MPEGLEVIGFSHIVSSGKGTGLTQKQITDLKCESYFFSKFEFLIEHKI